MSISTLSFNSASRTSLIRLQSNLAEATQEANTGRVVDVGRTLGRLTGSAVGARAEQNSFDEQQVSNGLVRDRIKNIDASLATISAGAEALADDLLGSGVATNFDTVVSTAKSGLQQLTGALNASGGSQYLFGGTETDKQPIAAYETTPASPAKLATTTSFSAFVLAATGGTDPKLVTAADMKSYLSTGYVDTATPPVTHRFDDLFNDANWSANWSQASNGEIASGISKTETIVSSASANDKAFRDIASAYTMLSDLGLGTLNADARKAVTDSAQTRLNAGADRIVNLRADAGTKLKRIEQANTELLRQEDIMEATVSSLEDIDIIEAGLKVTALETQLEASFAITGRIQKLSILDYI